MLRSRSINIRRVELVLVCIFGLPAVARERPSATEILDKYAANQDKIGSSIIYKCEKSGMGFGKAYSERSEVRCDGKHVRVLTHSDPERVLEKRNGVWCAGEVCGVGKGRYNSDLWEDDCHLRYEKVVGGEPRGRVWISGFEKPAHYSGYKVVCPDGFLWGFFHGYGSFQRVDAIVRKAKELSVRDKLGRTGVSRCYIIDAVTPYGKYVLWLDPERGYNIVKAQYLQRGDDRYWDDTPVGKGTSKYLSLRNVRLQEINGLWVPVEADYESKRTGPNSSYYKEHFKRTEVTLNPDFGPDAFAVDDVPDWAPVELQGTYPIDNSQYYWYEGKVTDYQGRPAEYKLNRPHEPILVGKALPNWKTLGLNLDNRELEGKRVLVCFCDLNELPSWYLVADLANRFEQLKQKGITTVVIQAPKLASGTLKEWEKTYRSMPWPLPFALNMVDEQVVRTRREWGVRCLPWLILADPEHIVTAEGFCLPVLLGKPLPDLKDYDRIDLDQTKDKRVLVCIGNVPADASWNCMKKLGEMAGELEQEGIAVLTLNAQASNPDRKVDEEKLLRYWKRYNNNVPFALPVGLTDKPFNQLWDEWGLPQVSSHSYPWLILTNHERVVVAEAFSLRQVDEIIRQSETGRAEDNPLMCLQTE